MTIAECCPRVARTFLSAHDYEGRQECLPHTTTLHRCVRDGFALPFLNHSFGFISIHSRLLSPRLFSRDSRLRGFHCRSAYQLFDIFFVLGV